MKIARLLVAVAMVGSVYGQAAPKADDLLRTARFVATLQHQDLQGTIRKDARGQQKIPVSLFLRGENIQFGYTNPKTRKETRFHMRLKNDRFDLFEVAPNGKTVQFADSKLGQPIENTDLSYEDLSMRFLYWPNGQVMGVEKIRGQECWKVWLQNPGKVGRYGYVYVWVHLKSGALM